LKTQTENKSEQVSEEIGKGHRRVCTVCLTNKTKECLDCTWPEFMRRPTRFVKDRKAKLPKGDLRGVE